MSNVAKDTMKEIRNSWRHFAPEIKQQFKRDWKKYLLFRTVVTTVIITSVVALIAFFVWLVHSHAMIAAIVIWSIIGMFVVGAVFSVVYREIDKVVRR